MDVKVLLPSGRVQILHALIDTGAQVNLLRKGIIPPGEFTRAKERLFLISANEQPIESCEFMVYLDLVFNREAEHGFEEVRVSADFFEADIRDEAILGCPWMMEKCIGVYPLDECLFVKTGEREVEWLWGCRAFLTSVQVGLRRRRKRRSSSRRRNVWSVGVQNIADD